MTGPTFKARVIDKAIPDQPGTVILMGAEVSEVEWDHGPKQFVSNARLIAAPLAQAAE